MALAFVLRLWHSLVRGKAAAGSLQLLLLCHCDVPFRQAMCSYCSGGIVHARNLHIGQD